VIPFTDATPLLDDHGSLRERFNEDGFIYLKGVVDRDLLLDLRAQITSVCDAHGWFAPGTDPLDAIPNVEPCVEGDERYFEVYDDVQRLEAFHAIPHDPTVISLLTPLLGVSAFPHPLGIARLMFPNNEDWFTPPHQDHPNNQGTQDLYACWIPLGDCPVDLGSLSLLRGSHQLGIAPLEYSLGPGNRRAALDERFQQLDWVGGDFELGDAVIFHSLTMHQSLPNTTDRMRLSVDYRFQREGEALTEGCLEPHFGRMTWDEIYHGWKRDELKYYWRDRQFTVVPWDPSFHQLSEEDHYRAMRVPSNWRREQLRLLVKELAKSGELRRRRRENSIES
jgi:hypothetical protein